MAINAFIVANAISRSYSSRKKMKRHHKWQSETWDISSYQVTQVAEKKENKNNLAWCRHILINLIITPFRTNKALAMKYELTNNVFSSVMTNGHEQQEKRLLSPYSTFFIFLLCHTFWCEFSLLKCLFFF